MFFPLKDDSAKGIQAQLNYWKALQPKTQAQARMKALRLFKLTSQLRVADCQKAAKPL